MRGLVGLPPDVTRVLDDLVDSLEVLDLLALLCRDVTRAWTAEEVSAEAGVPHRIASRSLARLRSGGVLAVDASTGACRFEPTDAQRAAAIAAVVVLLQTRRHELVNHVATRQLQRIQSIADSFRLRAPADANAPARSAAARNAREPARAATDEVESAPVALVPVWQRGG